MVWVTYFTNAFNFMDGIDGISAATTVAAACAYAWLAIDLGIELLAQAGLGLAAVVLGFATFNVLASGKFLGDVGSYFFGAGLGTLALALFLGGAGAVAVAAPLALYVGDTALVIVRRAVRGDDLAEAHREHTYQRLVDAGVSHASVSLSVGAITLACGSIGVASEGASSATRAGAALVVAAVVAGYIAAPTVRARWVTPRETLAERR